MYRSHQILHMSYPFMRCVVLAVPVNNGTNTLCDNGAIIATCVHSLVTHARSPFGRRPHAAHHPITPTTYIPLGRVAPRLRPFRWAARRAEGRVRA